MPDRTLTDACEDCGANVAPWQTECPHCGVDQTSGPPDDSRSRWRTLAVVAIFVLAVGAAVSYIGVEDVQQVAGLSDDGSPETTVEEFWTALNESNIDAANNQLAEESKYNGSQEVRIGAATEELTITVQRVAVDNKSDGVAYVSAAVQVRESGLFSGESTYLFTHKLVREGEGWVIVGASDSLIDTGITTDN